MQSTAHHCAPVPQVMQSHYQNLLLPFEANVSSKAEKVKKVRAALAFALKIGSLSTIISEGNHRLSQLAANPDNKQ